MARCRAASPLYAVPAEVVSAERAKQSAKCGRNLQIFADRRFRRILRYPQTVQVCLSWPLQIFLSFRAPFFLFRLKCLISISQEVVPEPVPPNHSKLRPYTAGHRWQVATRSSRRSGDIWSKLGCFMLLYVNLSTLGCFLIPIWPYLIFLTNHI